MLIHLGKKINHRLGYNHTEFLFLFVYYFDYFELRRNNKGLNLLVISKSLHQNFVTSSLFRSASIVFYFRNIILKLGIIDVLLQNQFLKLSSELEKSSKIQRKFSKYNNYETLKKTKISMESLKTFSSLIKISWLHSFFIFQ